MLAPIHSAFAATLFLSTTLASAQVPAVGPTKVVGVDCLCPGKPIQHFPPGTNCAVVCAADAAAPLPPPIAKTGSGTASSSLGTPALAETLIQGVASAVMAWSEQRTATAAARAAAMEAANLRWREYQRQLEDALIRQREAEREAFNRSKAVTLGQMKGTVDTGSLQMKGAASHPVQMKTIESAAEHGKRVAAAASALHARIDALGRSLSSAANDPSPAFYDLQLRHTGNPRMPGPNEIGPRYRPGWVTSEPVVTFEPDAAAAYTRWRAALTEWSRAAGLEYLFGAGDALIDNVVGRIPGADMATALFDRTKALYEEVGSHQYHTFGGALGQVRQGIGATATGRGEQAALDSNERFLGVTAERYDGWAHKKLEGILRSNLPDPRGQLQEELKARAGLRPREGDPATDRSFLERYRWTPETHVDWYRWPGNRSGKQ